MNWLAGSTASSVWLDSTRSLSRPSRRILTCSGTVEFMPIHFLHKSLNFDELIALYAVSDVCVISSTRDGMNLVAYEYIATQQKRHGVLVLSEFAGAAQSLNGSIIVNPWNTEEMAAAYQEAVTMSEEQKALNFSKLEKYVSKYTRYVQDTACQDGLWQLINLNPIVVFSGVSHSSMNSRGYPLTLRRRSKCGKRRCVANDRPRHYNDQDYNNNNEDPVK
jgi:hypothetical protein